MRLDQVMAEMKRKPDPHLLIEWISERCEGPTESLGVDIQMAIDAHDAALED